MATAYIGMVPSSTAAKLESTVSIESLVQLREFSGIAVCPYRNLIAVRIDRPSIADNKTYHDWAIVEWPSGNLRLQVDAGESVIGPIGRHENIRPHWSPDCQWIYYRALKDGQIQIWRVNAKSGNQEQITKSDADILSFKLIHDGKEIVYKTDAPRSAIADAEAKEYQSGVLLDENVFPWARLVKSLPVRTHWTTFKRWGLNSGGHLLSRAPSSYKVITIRGEKVRSATTSEIFELTNPNASLAEWIPQSSVRTLESREYDKAAIVLQKEKRRKNPILGAVPGSSRLGYVTRGAPSKVVECRSEHCSAEYLIPLSWSDDGSTIYFISEYTRRGAGIYGWTPESGGVRTILETEGTLGALASPNRSAPCPVLNLTAFCTTADHNSPPQLEAISLETGATKAVIEPNRKLRELFHLKTERIGWKDYFGRNSVGVLVYPRGFSTGTQYPLIITTYVCRGFLTGGIADGGPEYVLAEDGFLVLCVDVNPKLPLPDQTKEVLHGAIGYVAGLSEYESAIDLLADKGMADRNRVGITGLSFSAQAVSYALTHSSAIHVAALRALMVLEPGHEMFFRPGMELTESIKKKYNIGKGGHDAETIYKEISVTLRAEHVNAPILIQASESEYLGSLPAFSALQRLGKPVEMFVFPDETHQLFQPIHRAVNFGRNLDWFRFWLQGYEDPNPEKEDQYARWRKMRGERCARDEPEDEKPSYCGYSNAIH